MATIKEIAAIVGVSRGTVDRVVNNRGAVAPETAQKVRQLINALDYTPNAAGKFLALKKKELQLGCILFSSNTDTPFYDDVLAGIENTRTMYAGYGVHIEVACPDFGNWHLQIELMDQMLQKGIRGLVITPFNHPDVAKKMLELAQKGVPVVTTNSDIACSGRLAYVGSDPVKSGRTAAGILCLATQNKAKVGIVVGSPMVLCHAERVAGFCGRIEEKGVDVQVVSTVENNDDDLIGYTQTKQMLQNYPEITALYLASAGIRGACRAVEELGLSGKIVIVCFDTTPVVKKMLEKNVITATIGQQLFVQGEKPLELLVDYLGMGIKPDTDCYYTNTEIYLCENLL